MSWPESTRVAVNISVDQLTSTNFVETVISALHDSGMPAWRLELEVTESIFLRDGTLACVVAEVKTADQTVTRRLQLAASDGKTPMLLYRRHRARERCPLGFPSSAMTRWRIGCAASDPLPYAGVGRARWLVELVRQRGGHPFSLEVEACDDTGRLALPAAVAHRAPATAGAASQAA